MTASTEQENFYRHSTVIVDHVKDCFTNLLHYYLEQQGEAGITLKKFVMVNQHFLYHLFDTTHPCCLCSKNPRIYPRGMRPLLFQSQMNIMFESSSSGTSSSSCEKFCCAKVKSGLKLKHFDVTLASVLLTECTKIVPPTSNARKALESLRKIRNESLGHAKEGRMSTCDYESSMKKIESDLIVITNIYGEESEIKDIMASVRKQPFNTELYNQLQRTMNMMDRQNSQLEEVLKMLGDIKEETRKRKHSEDSSSTDGPSTSQAPRQNHEDGSLGTGQFFGQVATSIFKLATTDKGEFDRGNGKIVTWSYQGTFSDFRWKYRATCVDDYSKQICTAVETEKEEAINQALRGLFRKLHIPDAQLPHISLK